MGTRLDALMKRCRARTGEYFRFAMFLSIGGTVAVFNLVLVWLFSRFTHLPYVIYISLAIECSILASFLLNDRVTFQGLAGHGRPWYQRCVRFHAAAAIGAIATIGISTTVHQMTHWRPVMAQCTAIVCATAVNFIMHRFWTYRRPARGATALPYEVVTTEAIAN